MGLFSGGGVLGSIGGALGLNTDEQQDAARAAAGQQTDASNRAISEQRAARLAQQEILQPFVQVGLGPTEKILDEIFEGDVPGQTGLLGASQGISRFGRAGAQNLLEQAGQIPQFEQNPLVGQAQAGIQGILGQQPLGLDPSVLESPFFKALRDEATRNLEGSAAARGRVGSGDTDLAIGRAGLQLGQQFAQQDLQNRIAAQGQQFNQLQAGLQAGQGLGQQRFGNLLAGQQQQFGQTQQGLGLGLSTREGDFTRLNEMQQRNLANELAVNAQRFGQFRDLLSVGQASAAGVGAGGLQSAGNVGNLLTGIGNAQAAGTVGAANAAAQGSQNLLGLASGAGGGALAGSLGLLGSGVGAGGGAALGLLGISDRRLKTNIQELGVAPNGLPVYSFEYIFEDGENVGYMAQDVEKVFPNAVIEISGFKVVNYGAIPWQ